MEQKLSALRQWKGLEEMDYNLLTYVDKEY